MRLRQASGTAVQGSKPVLKSCAGVVPPEDPTLPLGSRVSLCRGC